MKGKKGHVCIGDIRAERGRRERYPAVYIFSLPSLVSDLRAVLNGSRVSGR